MTRHSIAFAKGEHMRSNVVLLTVLLLLTGCATEQPQLVTVPGVSLAGYKTLAVAPASNDTGQSSDFDFAAIFTDDLKSALQAKGYDVSDANAAPADALIVQCSFVNYAPGNAFQRWLLPGLGTTQTTVKTTLIDKKTGKALGDMVTIKAITGGFFGGVGGYRSILESVASDVSTAIDNKIKGA